MVPAQAGNRVGLALERELVDQAGHRLGEERRVDGAVEVDGVARGQLHLDLGLGVDAGRVAPPAERRVVVHLALPGDDARVVDVVADRPGQLVVAGIVEEPLEDRQLRAVLDGGVPHDDAVVAAGVTDARVAQGRPVGVGGDLVADQVARGLVWDDRAVGAVVGAADAAGVVLEGDGDVVAEHHLVGERRRDALGQRGLHGHVIGRERAGGVRGHVGDVRWRRAEGRVLRVGCAHAGGADAPVATDGGVGEGVGQLEGRAEAVRQARPRRRRPRT